MSDGVEYDFFGRSAATDGNTLVAGADGETGGGTAYVFLRSNDAETGKTVWTQQQKLEAEDVDRGDEFGNNVAVSGRFIAVGAIKDNNNQTEYINDSGAVYLFA